jgi:HSP20 family protein
MSYPVHDPYDTLTPLRDVISRFLGDGLLSPERLMTLGHTMPVDVIETPDDFVIEASLTGVKPSNVQITATRTGVTIHVGHKVHAKAEEEGIYLRRERYERHGPEMTRTIALPAEIDPDKIEATYEHGVLTLRVPKDEATKPKTIRLHVAREQAERQ